MNNKQTKGESYYKRRLLRGLLLKIGVVGAWARPSTRTPPSQQERPVDKRMNTYIQNRKRVSQGEG